MQRFPPFLRHPGIIIATLCALIACGVLFVRFGPQISVDPANTLQQQPLGAQPTFDPLADAPDTPDATPVQPAITVYVSGAVHAPDVYTLPANARIKDLVIAAGGMTEDADADQVNLARHLKDEDHIQIPRVGAAPTDAAATAPGTDVAITDGKRIDINTASATALEQLDGIGTALAQRIIEYRTANGPFASVEDLKNVKGIGSALFDKIAPAIMVGPT